MNQFNTNDLTDQYVLSVCENFQQELHRVMLSSHTSTDNIDTKRE